MNNLRGAILMVISMGCFALEDMFIKLMSESALPTGQILLMLGVFGGLSFTVIAWSRGQRILSRAYWHLGVQLRIFGEIIGTGCFVLAFTLGDLTTTSAIFQAMPLAVTLGAAWFLGQEVGWRRYSAIIVGLFGVILVIQPWSGNFSALSLLAVGAVIGLGARDVATQIVPKSTTSLQLAAWGFFSVAPLGAVIMAFEVEPATLPDGINSLRLIAAVAIGVVGYYLLTAATRTGEVAVVAPFRYARLVFAMMIGLTVFGERPDFLTYLGATIIVASGLYTLYREARARRASLS
jgi:drug/metabolite transporter (DMT)-like permease